MQDPDRQPASAASADRRDFLAYVTHDMRDPLNVIVGMARLLGETPLDEEQRAYVGAIGDAADTLLTLVNDILDLSRIEAGRLTLAKIDFDLHAFLERLVTMLEPAAQARGTRLHLHLSPDLPRHVRGDPARLRQVLLNLVGNAIKYAGEARIRLEAAPESNASAAANVRFDVVDDGRGITPEALARLFEPWTRGDEAGGSDRPPGSGLGLLLARRLCEAMGGVLTVESAPGQGTRACARIRLEPVTRREPEGATKPAGEPLSGLRLLVVDPHPRSRLQTTALAGSWGVQVAGVASVDEALDAIARDDAAGCPPDIVIVDRDVADAGVDTLIGAVRSRAGTGGARLVLLAAGGLRGDAEIAGRSGFDAFLPKPLSAERLHACLVALRSGRPPRLLTVHDLDDHEPRRLRILVADDNAANLKLLSVLLQRLGHEVVAARDGREALERLDREPVDLVLLDVQMPVMDGVETVGRIRAHPDPAKAALPVVAVTANALPEDVDRYRRCGMTDCLAKPIDRAALLAAIARCA